MSIERGVPAPRPLIWLREGFGPIALREFLIMEVIPGAREFDRFLVGELDAGRLRGSDKASLIRAFAEFVARLHGKGIFHRDLKTCNLLGSRGANEGDFSFALLDYDDLSFPGVVSETRRIKNLAQLFLSTPVAFGRSDRSRFLRHYCREARYGNARKKRLARGVLESVLGKRILFVGFDGDVVETL
jgi:serine/threonine protein kinase